MPAVQALSSPSREAAEDNVEEREKFWVGRNYGLRITDYLQVWTDRRGIWNSILDLDVKKTEMLSASKRDKKLQILQQRLSNG